MTQQVIINTPAGSGNGDAATVAFGKCNNNFTELYSNIQPPTNVVNVLAFGADPTGVLDSRVAIQTADAAATLARQTLYFPPGTYSVNMAAGIVRGGASWLGAGRYVSIIQAAAASFTSAHFLVQIDNKSNFTTSRLGFDITLASFAPGAVGSAALLCVNDVNWATYDCAFTGIQPFSFGTYPNGGDRWSVNDCYFNASLPSTNSNQAINIQNSSGRHQVCRNVCIGTGIFSASGEGIFEANVVSAWLFGSGITIDAAPAGPRGINNRIIGNYCLNGLGSPDVNSTFSHGIENSSGNAIIIGNHCVGNAGGGIITFGPSPIIQGNVCLNNNQGLSGVGGITAYSIPQASGGNLESSGGIIVDNILSDIQGVPTQKYGYLEQNITNGFGTGSLNNMLVARNRATGNVTAPYLFVGTSPVTDQLNGALQLQSQTAVAAGSVGTPILLFSSTTGLGLYACVGVPTFSAAQGSTCYNISGAAGARSYTNTSAGSGTTWTAATTP